MPLTSKGKEVLGSMRKQYGSKKGEQVFYASINAGKVKGAEKGKGFFTHMQAGQKASYKIYGGLNGPC